MLLNSHQNYSTELPLTVEDFSELKASGLGEIHIKELGHFSIESAKESKKLTGIKHRGLVFQYLNPLTGKNYLTSKGKPFYRMKPRDWNEVERNWHEDPPKYLSPPGEGNRPYWSNLIQGFNVKAKKTSIPLEIVEGEKKADSLSAEGFFVVGLAGVYGWLDKSSRGEEIDVPPAQMIEDSAEDQEALQEKLEKSRLIPELIDSLTWNNRRVNIAFDSDLWEKPDVRAAATQLALALRELGAQPYIVRLPGEISGEKNGPDDLKVRHGIEAYAAMVKRAQPALSTGKVKRLNIQQDPRPLTKIMMTWAILKDHWRFRPNVGWYHWENNHWVLRSLDEFERELTFFQDAQGWELLKGLDLLVRQLKSRLLVPDESWNPENLIAFANGTLDFASGEFRDGHERENFITNVLPYDYSTNEECPAWLGFLNEALQGDTEAIALLQAFMKWVLIPKPRNRKAEIEKCLDLIGPKGTGKGTFLDVLTALVGPGNHGAIDQETFKNSAYLAALLDKKVSIDYDAFGYMGNVGLFNKVVSNEVLPIKFLYKNAIETRLGTVVVRAYNRVLEVPDGSEGLDRRIIAVSFNHTPKAVDLELSSKLQAELPGIFAWAWSVPVQEMKRRLVWAGSVPLVAEASIKRFEANNPEYVFLSEFFPDGSQGVKAGDLYATYSDWCKQSGFQAKKHRKFTEAIQSFGCKNSGKSTGGYYYYTIPEMKGFDLISHMGLAKPTKENQFQKSFSPSYSTLSTIPVTERVSMSSPLSTQLSTPEVSPLSIMEGSLNNDALMQVDNRVVLNSSGQSSGVSSGQSNPYPVWESGVSGVNEPKTFLKTHNEKSIGVGDWVEARKSLPEGSLKVSCSNHKLQVLEIRQKTGVDHLEALVKRSTWFHEGFWIELRYLDFVEKGELPTPVEQLPTTDLQKGDRILSEMSGKTGVITRTNTRRTFILWDKDRDMGLPEMEYTPNDLEVMRIGKALKR